MPFMRKGIFNQLTLLLLTVTTPMAAQSYSVAVDLRCSKPVFEAGEPVVCFVEIVNHQSKSHVIYVPSSLFPTRVAGWPVTVLELDVRKDAAERPLPNLWLTTGTLDMAGFNERNLQPLDFGRLVGWEMDLKNGVLWRYALEPGHYRVRAHVRIDILGSLKRSTRLSAAVQRALGSRFRDADKLVLNGEFTSNEVTFSVN
jgi:hypothetical protein